MREERFKAPNRTMSQVSVHNAQFLHPNFGEDRQQPQLTFTGEDPLQLALY